MNLNRIQLNIEYKEAYSRETVLNFVLFGLLCIYITSRTRESQEVGTLEMNQYITFRVRKKKRIWLVGYYRKFHSQVNKEGLFLLYWRQNNSPVKSPIKSLWHFLSSSCCRAISTDIPDPLSPPLPIVYRFRQVLRATPRTLTELLYVGSSWSPCFCWAM